MTQTLALRGRAVALRELGAGPPLLYLHDLIDVHSASEDWLPFHRRLAERFRVLAPAFPGCGGSDEDLGAEGADDVVLDLLDVVDALGIGSLPVVGVGVGGWMGAELAVRHRQLVERLVLVGATGLFVPNEPIADVFYALQPRDGLDMSELRAMLFGDPESAAARTWAPDGRMSIDREMLRFKAFRFASRIGFRPPYLYNRRLAERLPRFDRPALIVWGERDGLVPPAHARAYAERLPDARLVTVPGAGHCLHLEAPDRLAETIVTFLSSR